MALETFSFPYHTQATDYPDSGFRAKLGNSYEFTAPPPAPDQRVFSLSFPLLKYFVSAGAITLVTRPEINMAVLEAFYNRHKTYKTFIYPHPVYGNVNVKFSKPLKIPKGTEGADGAIHNIEIELTEQPL